MYVHVGLYCIFKNKLIEFGYFPVRSGANTVERRSVESTVTIPYEQTFRNLTTNRPASGDSLEGFNYCGCGWPQHMLIAKGNAEGFPCDLFVMVTDNRNDTVRDLSLSLSNVPFRSKLHQ